MGFNLVGVALSERFIDKQALCSLLGLGEVTLVDDHAIFENASSSYAMGDQDIYITEVGNGTLITTAVIPALPFSVPE